MYHSTLSSEKISTEMLWNLLIYWNIFLLLLFITKWKWNWVSQWHTMLHILNKFGKVCVQNEYQDIHYILHYTNKYRGHIKCKVLDILCILCIGYHMLNSFWRCYSSHLDNHYSIKNSTNKNQDHIINIDLDHLHHIRGS